MTRIKRHRSEVIRRRRTISFFWQGTEMQGYEGDTLASALLANGISVVGHSFKYGRPRAVMTCGVEEPNALVTLETDGYHTPNVKATEISLYKNLQAWSATSTTPDWRQKLRFLAKCMPAGFYYKTFMSPASLWPWYEKKIREHAGFSSAPQQPDAEYYDHQYHHYDLVVVGAGVTGMAAVLAAKKTARRICLIDERPITGGETIAMHGSNNKAITWLERARKTITESKNIDLLTRTTAFALHDQNFILALERLQDHITPNARNTKKPRQRLHKIRAGCVLLATGAHERPLMFANNDLPGVMLSSSAQRYANEFSVLCGQQVVIAGNNDSIYQCAIDLKRHGAESVTLMDIRSQQFVTETANPVLQTQLNDIKKQGIDIHWQTTPSHASGKTKIQSVHLLRVGIDSEKKHTSIGAAGELPCDLLLSSGGFNPVVHLDCHTGEKPYFDCQKQAFLAGSSLSDRQLAGSVTGISDWQQCIASGERNVQVLLGDASDDEIFRVEGNPSRVSTFFVPANRNYCFIDFQNDVAATDIELAIRENYQSIEHIKRYTALGFGTDQGKTGNVNGIAVASQCLHIPMDAIGTTTFRPAYTPVTFGALAGAHGGELFEPERFTPMHQSHVDAEAQWERVGQWFRPWYFPRDGETMDQAVARESVQARRTVAMMDASTLGKIDIQGRDAREFLARVYTNAWKKLAKGNCRYGLMCNDSGMIIDDGVTACLDNNHFLMTTTTGGAANVLTQLEMWQQTEWPNLKVWLTSVTDHWSTTAVVGPQARHVVQQVCPDVDFSAQAFPFMAWRSGTVCGVPARIMRISFSGELAYEVNVQANYGRYVWNQIADAAKEYDLVRYGTETMHLLRAEKGYIIVGQDTDGSITPEDANMRWALANKKPFSYIGKRSMQRPDLTRLDRKQLVGLYNKNPKVVLPEGCQLVAEEDDRTMIGHVTSSYMSPNLKRSIAMAVVKGGLQRMGETIYAKPIDGSTIPVTIGSSVFYDAKQEKIDGEA